MERSWETRSRVGQIRLFLVVGQITDAVHITWRVVNRVKEFHIIQFMDANTFLKYKNQTLRKQIKQYTRSLELLSSYHDNKEVSSNFAHLIQVFILRIYQFFLSV